jgi:hypothetical protein
MLRSPSMTFRLFTSAGTRFRYERDRSAVGQEMVLGSEAYVWHVLARSDLIHAKRCY